MVRTHFCSISLKPDLFLIFHENHFLTLSPQPPEQDRRICFDTPLTSDSSGESCFPPNPDSNIGRRRPSTSSPSCEAPCSETPTRRQSVQTAWLTVPIVLQVSQSQQQKQQSCCRCFFLFLYSFQSFICSPTKNAWRDCLSAGQEDPVPCLPGS